MREEIVEQVNHACKAQSSNAAGSASPGRGWMDPQDDFGVGRSVGRGFTSSRVRSTGGDGSSEMLVLRMPLPNANIPGAAAAAAAAAAGAASGRRTPRARGNAGLPPGASTLTRPRTAPPLVDESTQRGSPSMRRSPLSNAAEDSNKGTTSLPQPAPSGRWKTSLLPTLPAGAGQAQFRDLLGASVPSQRPPSKRIPSGSWPASGSGDAEMLRSASTPAMRSHTRSGAEKRWSTGCDSFAAYMEGSGRRPSLCVATESSVQD